MSERRVSAIVLAGGRSSRFGRDKLGEPLAGRTLLDHAIAAVSPLAQETIVVARPEAMPRVPDGTTVVHDRSAFEGPLVGLLTRGCAARTNRSSSWSAETCPPWSRPCSGR